MNKKFKMIGLAAGFIITGSVIIGTQFIKSKESTDAPIPSVELEKDLIMNSMNGTEHTSTPSVAPDKAPKEPPKITKVPIQKNKPTPQPTVTVAPPAEQPSPAGIIYTCDDFEIYVEEGITVSDKLISEMNRAVAAYKEYIPAKYLPEGGIIPSFRITFSNAADYPAYTTKTEDGVYNLVLMKDYLSIFTAYKNYWVLFHELSHAVDGQNVGFPLCAMVEGYADVVSTDFIKHYNPMWDSAPNYSLHLSKEDWADFEQYFTTIGYDNADPVAAYKAGYLFINYLQDQYGDEIIKTIMEECKSTVYDEGKTLSSELMIEVIKARTSPEVFLDFVDWYQT